MNDFCFPPRLPSSALARRHRVVFAVQLDVAGSLWRAMEVKEVRSPR